MVIQATYRYDPLDRLAMRSVAERGCAEPSTAPPGFNGEHPDPLTAHYPLGRGYRSYNPTLMRFNSPDSLSPFGTGGLNAYVYCAGDPVNHVDPNGHEARSEQAGVFIWIGLGLLGAFFGLASAAPAIKAAFGGSANLGQKLTTGIALGSVTASTVYTTSRVARAEEPDASSPEFLLWTALSIGIPIAGVRAVLALKPGPARWWMDGAQASGGGVAGNPIKMTAFRRASINAVRTSQAPGTHAYAHDIRQADSR